MFARVVVVSYQMSRSSCAHFAFVVVRRSVSELSSPTQTHVTVASSIRTPVAHYRDRKLVKILEKHDFMHAK